MKKELASKRVAKNLRSIRSARNLSQEALSKVSGVPKSTINHIESGTSSPSIDTLDSLAEALSIAVEELLFQPSKQVEMRTAREMPVFKRIEGVGRIVRIQPDPFPGFDLYFVEIEAGCRMPGVLQAKGGKKLIYGISGSLEISTGGEVYLLDPGGSCFFQGDEAHSLKNPGATRASFMKIHFY